MNFAMEIPFYYVSETINYTNNRIKNNTLKEKKSLTDRQIFYLRNILQKANKELNTKQFICNIYSNEIKKEIKKFDRYVNVMRQIMEFFKSLLTQEQVKIFIDEYNLFLQNLDEIKESLEIFANNEIWQEVTNINQKNNTDYIKFNPNMLNE